MLVNLLSKLKMKDNELKGLEDTLTNGGKKIL